MAILKCTCKHNFQDRMYGGGMRVFNPLKKSQTHSNHARCTVCLAIKEIKYEREE